MSTVPPVLGAVHGPFEVVLDADRVSRYCEVTSGALGGLAVPPMFLAMLAFEVQGEAFGDVPRTVVDGAGARVHGEHEIRVARPLVPGEALHTTTLLTGVRPNRAGTVIVQRFDHRDGDGELVAEQWWSLFLGGVALPEEGEPAPDHAWPDDSRSRPLRQVTVPIDDDVARAYADVSGDWSDHHFDAAAAARSGATRPFLHGLCTLSLCAAAVGFPGRLRRVAARFAAPALLGHDLVVDLYDAGADRIAFEATCAGVVVLRHGLAELAPS